MTNWIFCCWESSVHWRLILLSVSAYISTWAHTVVSSWKHLRSSSSSSGTYISVILDMFQGFCPARGALNHLSPACCVQTSKINNKKCRCARESVSCDHSLVNPRMNFYCHSAVFAAIAGYIDMKCCQNTRKGYVTDGLRLHYSAYGCAFVHTFGLTPLPRCFPSRKNTTPPADRTTRVNKLLSGINPCCV